MVIVWNQIVYARNVAVEIGMRVAYVKTAKEDWSDYGRGATSKKKESGEGVGGQRILNPSILDRLRR
jgi:hypothetical protein